MKSPLVSLALILLTGVLSQGCGSSDNGNGTGPGPVTGSVVINEFLASNDEFYPDEAGEFDDWIELYNPTDRDIDLAGYALSDDPGDPTKSVLPSGSDLTTIAAGGYLLLWADEDSIQGPLHLDFKLNDRGESISLYTPGGDPLDVVTYGRQFTNLSYGRSPDAGRTWAVLEHPTPGEANAAPVDNLAPIIQSVAHEPAVPREGQAVLVTVESYDDHGIEEVLVHYTVDSGAEQTVAAESVGEEEYRAVLPGQDGGTEVSYYVTVTDGDGATTTDPRFAPTSTYSYTVSASDFAPPLFINEFLASNQTINQDEAGEFDDWIEIYNAGSEAIDIGGMYLSDDLANPTLFQIPATDSAATTILPGGFLVLWADNDPVQGILHTTFKLSAGGESLGLFAGDDQDNVLIDSYSFGEQVDDVSMGRLPDGSSNWASFTTPTPGGSNQP